jgi:hypothetical protein
LPITREEAAARRLYSFSGRASEPAAGILDGLAGDAEDIFPDPNAQAMSQTWWRSPKAFERAFAGA